MTKFSTFRFFASATKKQASYALCLLTVVCAPARGDLAGNYQNAAKQLSTSPSGDAMSKALNAASHGDYSQLQGLVAQKYVNTQQSNQLNQAAAQLRATEAPVNLPRTQASQTLAPAYMAPAVATPAVGRTPAPRIDSAQVISASDLLESGAISGITFPRANAPAPAPQVQEKVVAAPASAVSADTGDIDDAIAVAQPTPRATRAPYQLPRFNARELDDLTASITVSSSLSPNMALRPETNARRNAASRLLGGMREPASVPVNETAPNFQPSWYTRGLVPTGLTRYMESNRIVRGSTDGARASNGRGLVVAPQTVRRPSSMLVGVPHDRSLRSAASAASEEKPPGSDPGDPSHGQRSGLPQTNPYLPLGNTGSSAPGVTVGGLGVSTLTPGFFR